MRWIWLALAITAVVSLLWIAGETHRGNCIEARRSGCSMLPWEHGGRAHAIPVRIQREGSGFGGAGFGGSGGFP